MKKIPISIRLSQELLDRVEKFVKSSPGISDRTHLIEIALDKLINSQPQKR